MCWAVPKRMRQDRRALIRAPLIAFAMASASAQDLMPLQPEASDAAEVRIGDATDVRGWAPDDSPVVIARLTRLVIEGSETGVPAIEHNSVRLRGMSVAALDGLADELAEWIDKPLTHTGLDRLTEVILRHYDDHDRPMNDIRVPPQTGEGGRLSLEVTEGRIGEVGLERMNRFNNRVVESGLRLRQGDLLTGAGLQADLDWLSRNPFRQAEIFAAAGEGVTADLLLRVREARPWRIYGGYDNSGSESVGGDRWFVGFNHANAFGLDHVVGYQFTMGESLDALHAHALAWEIPLHSRHRFVRLSGAWAEVTSVESFAGQPVTAEGSSWQTGILYGRPLPRLGSWRQEILGGIEFKRADNFVIFGQTSFPQTEVEIVQLRGEWHGGGPLRGGRADLRAELVASPGGLTNRNGRAEFAAFRPGADPTYAYARLGGNWLAPLPGGWSWRMQTTLQLATGPLLPTEQLGLGGNATVRGYTERSLLADSGYAATAELRTPVFAAMENLPLQGLLFLDHGRGWRDGDGASSLTGAGVGLRLGLGKSGTARLDIGRPLRNGRGTEVHGGVMFSF